MFGAHNITPSAGPLLPQYQVYRAARPLRTVEIKPSAVLMAEEPIHLRCVHKFTVATVENHYRTVRNMRLPVSMRRRLHAASLAAETQQVGQMHSQLPCVASLHETPMYHVGAPLACKAHSGKGALSLDLLYQGKVRALTILAQKTCSYCASSPKQYTRCRSITRLFPIPSLQEERLVPALVRELAKWRTGPVVRW